MLIQISEKIEKIITNDRTVINYRIIIYYINYTYILG